MSFAVGVVTLSYVAMWLCGYDLTVVAADAVCMTLQSCARRGKRGFSFDSKSNIVQ